MSVFGCTFVAGLLRTSVCRRVPRSVSFRAKVHKCFYFERTAASVSDPVRSTLVVPSTKSTRPVHIKGRGGLARRVILTRHGSTARNARPRTRVFIAGGLGTVISGPQHVYRIWTRSCAQMVFLDYLRVKTSSCTAAASTTAEMLRYFFYSFDRNLLHYTGTGKLLFMYSGRDKYLRFTWETSRQHLVRRDRKSTSTTTDVHGQTGRNKTVKSDRETNPIKLGVAPTKKMRFSE